MNYWTDNFCTKIILIHSRLPICRVASCSVQGFQHDFLPALPSSLCLSSFCSYVKCTSVASAMQTETSRWINCLLRQWHLKLVRTSLALLNSSPFAWEDWWYSLLVDTTVKYASHNEECAGSYWTNCITLRTGAELCHGLLSNAGAFDTGYLCSALTMQKRQPKAFDWVKAGYSSIGKWIQLQSDS